jgi:hypothetical protein
VRVISPTCMPGARGGMKHEGGTESGKGLSGSSRGKGRGNRKEGKGGLGTQFVYRDACTSASSLLGKAGTFAALSSQLGHFKFTFHFIRGSDYCPAGRRYGAHAVCAALHSADALFVTP